jgi:hypothetical protein
LPLHTYLNTRLADTWLGAVYNADNLQGAIEWCFKDTSQQRISNKIEQNKIEPNQIVEFLDVKSCELFMEVETGKRQHK